MLCVTRYAIAAVSITLALARCKDPAAPPGTRPTMSIGSVSASENGKYIVVFTGDNAPADFAARVSARGGTVETVLDGVGVAVVSGLTHAAAGDLASTQDINAVARLVPTLPRSLRVRTPPKPRPQMLHPLH